MQKSERMKELVALLNEYAYRYYTLDEPVVATNSSLWSNI